MYTDVPLWGLSQSQQERPSFVLFLARPSPQWFILHQFYSHLPLLHHSVSPMVPKPGFGGTRCFFPLSFFPLSPCPSLFCIYLGIPDSSVYPTSPLSSLVGCRTRWRVWGIGWRGRRGPQLEASELRERLRGTLMKGRKWWSVGCLTDGIKHPEMIKHVRYLTGWAAVG